MPTINRRLARTLGYTVIGNTMINGVHEQDFNTWKPENDDALMFKLLCELADTSKHTLQYDFILFPELRLNPLQLIGCGIIENYLKAKNVK